jgi:hypothetical protein
MKSQADQLLGATAHDVPSGTNSLQEQQRMFLHAIKLQRTALRRQHAILFQPSCYG